MHCLHGPTERWTMSSTMASSRPLTPETTGRRSLALLATAVALVFLVVVAELAVTAFA